MAMFDFIHLLSTVILLIFIILIISHYVKDKDNLFPYKIWSGGDLNEQLIYNTDYLSGHQISINRDNEYSFNGDYSFKLSPGEQAWLRFKVNISSEDIGKIITVQAKVYSPNNSIQSNLLFNNNNTLIKNITVNVARNTKFVNVQISSEIIENTTECFFNFSCSSNLFIDDLYVSKRETKFTHTLPMVHGRL